MKVTAVTLLKFAVTILLFFLLFKNIDFYQFWSTLQNARLPLLLLGFAVLWVGHYLCVLRWRMLMRPLMPVPSLGQLFGIYCIGAFFNLAFPTLVGGDVVKMYYAGRPSRLYAQSFAATFLDRDLGLFAMLIIACCATLIKPLTIPGVPVLLIVWAVFAAFLLANGILFTPRLHRLFANLLHKLRLSRLATKIDTVSHVLSVIGRHWTVLAAALLISFFNQILVILVIWIMSQGLRLDVPIVYFFVFVPVITLVSMIPISLSGIGLREYAFMSFFTGIGVARESCIALGLLSSSIVIVSAIPGGIVYLLFKNRSDTQEMAALETNFS